MERPKEGPDVAGEMSFDRLVMDGAKPGHERGGAVGPLSAQAGAQQLDLTHRHGQVPCLDSLEGEDHPQRVCDA